MKHLLLTTIAAVVLVGTVFADPIHDAARNGDLAGVQAELDNGADVNVKNKHGMTPLHDAAAEGRKEIAELLIAKGADVNANDRWGMTPLHLAAYYGHKEIVELLIAKGADVNAKDDMFGRTLLHDAALGGHKEIVELLITAGADVNAKDEGGGTPLHSAAYRGHKEIAELLIAKGADVNVQAASGRTPLDGALEINDWGYPEDKAAKKETADLLRKHGGKTAKELWLMPRLVLHSRFAFSFDTKEGMTYEVQDSLNLTNWEVIKTYKGTGGAVRFDEERDHDPPQIFYRIKVVE